MSGKSPGPNGKNPRYAGYIVGRGTLAELKDEVFAYPPDERPARFAAYIRRGRLEAEEQARRRIDALLDE